MLYPEELLMAADEEYFLLCFESVVVENVLAVLLLRALNEASLTLRLKMMPYKRMKMPVEAFKMMKMY